MILAVDIDIENGIASLSSGSGPYIELTVSTGDSLNNFGVTQSPILIC